MAAEEKTQRMNIVEWQIKFQRPQVYRTGKEITHRTQMATLKWETFSFKGELGASSEGGLCLQTQLVDDGLIHILVWAFVLKFV